MAIVVQININVYAKCKCNYKTHKANNNNHIEHPNVHLCNVAHICGVF